MPCCAGQQCAATVSNAEQSGSFSVANFSFSDNCKQLEVQVKVAEFNSAVFVQFNSVIIPQVTPDCAFGIYLRNQAGSSRSICTNYTTFSLTMFGNSLIIQFAAKTSFSVTYNAVSNVSSLVANEEKTGQCVLRALVPTLFTKCQVKLTSLALRRRDLLRAGSSSPRNEHLRDEDGAGVNDRLRHFDNDQQVQCHCIATELQLRKSR